MKIFKYELKLQPGEQTITLPKGATVLSAAIQNPESMMAHVWALVDPIQEATEEYTFTLAWTGKDVPAGLEYSQFLTTILDDMGLVWHIFYTKQKDA